MGVMTGGNLEKKHMINLNMNSWSDNKAGVNTMVSCGRAEKTSLPGAYSFKGAFFFCIIFFSPERFDSDLKSRVSTAKTSVCSLS